MRVAKNSGQTIKGLVKTKDEMKNDSKQSVVYEIPCGGCLKTYVGETGRGVKTRLNTRTGGGGKKCPPLRFFANSEKTAARSAAIFSVPAEN